MLLADLKFSDRKFLAFVLDEATRALLLRRYPPVFEKVVCHHVTIKFKMTPEEFENYQVVYTEPPTVVITGYACEDGVEAFSVNVNGKFEDQGQVFHLTHSHAEKKAPKDSHALIRSGAAKPVQHVTLGGELKLIKK